MTDFKDTAMGYPTSLAPTGTWPLDSRSYFESKEDAIAAAAKAEETSLSGTSMYYYGQRVAVVEDNVVTYYYIGSDKQLHKLLDEFDGSVIDAQITSLQSGKRDKVDLSVYSVTRTENMDWTWESENAELAEVLNNGIKLEYNETSRTWVPQHDPDGYWSEPKLGSKEELSVSIVVHDNDTDEQYTATATRPRYMDETLGPAKQNQQLAAVATDDAAKPADGSLMKYDAANDRFVKAVEGTDYLKTHQDISGKFDATHDFDGENASLRWEAFYLAVHAPFGLYVLRGGMMADEHDQHGQYVRTHTLFQKADRATTLSGYGITDGATKTELAAAVSTNNPAFVSAVQNTPAPEPGQGEDPPWGTWGTVGAAIAGLVAGLKWLKDKVFDSAGNIQDQFATDLLGKQVANIKANTASLAAAYSETETYAVGDSVTHDGKLYKCAVAITTAEGWTPAHWTETTVATLWNNADTTSYGGQN